MCFGRVFQMGFLFGKIIISLKIVIAVLEHLVGIFITLPRKYVHRLYIVLKVDVLTKPHEYHSFSKALVDY